MSESALVSENRRDRTRTQERYGLSADASILHCPRPLRRADWREACALLFSDEDLRDRFAVPDELTIITYNTRPEISLIERCLAHLGIPECVVLGKGVTDWGWIHKITLVLDYLETGRCDSEYILCLDADDTLMLKDPGEILNRFQASGSKILFCNTMCDAPPSPECFEFENSIAEYSDPAHRHLNAGGYIGETAFIRGRLREIAHAYRTSQPWCFRDTGFDDQLAWRHMHRKYYPEIKIDAACRVFLRFDEAR